jgi:hypothetical protein
VPTRSFGWRRSASTGSASGSASSTWLHPNDLTDEVYFERVGRILAHAARCRDVRGLRIETMGTVAENVAGVAGG